MTYLLANLSTSHLIQAVIIGAVLAFLTATVLINAKIRSILITANGWSTSLKVGQPGGGLLLRAATSKFLPAANLAQETVYWLASVDGAHQALSGQHDYVLHFPAGQLPPNDAFWSLTLTDPIGYMPRNSIERHSLGDRSGLVPNPDGSIDIFIQQTAPAGHEANWLPAPSGKFKLTLRAYLPGEAILEGRYQLPPVVKVR